MMRRSTTCLALAAIIAPGIAHACPQSDIAGTWSLFVTRTRLLEPGTWARCRMNIATNGVVSPATSSCKDAEGAAVPVLAGSRLRLQSDCSITGPVLVRIGGKSVRYTVVEGQLDRTKSTMSGVGTFPGAGRFSFTGVLR